MFRDVKAPSPTKAPSMRELAPKVTEGECECIINYNLSVQAQPPSVLLCKPPSRCGTET